MRLAVEKARFANVYGRDETLRGLPRPIARSRGTADGFDVKGRIRRLT